MQSASISLKQAEKNWTDYEALPRDPRQSSAAAAEIKRNYDIYHNALVELMNRLIDSMHYIVCGDLVKPIEVDGSNEVGQLAQSLRHMQGELMRTVSDVRNGANAVYSRASEIVTGNSDLFIVLKEETAASMEQLTATVKQNAGNVRQARRLTDAVAVFHIQQEQQRQRETSVVIKTAMPVAPRKVVMADNGENWETF